MRETISKEAKGKDSQLSSSSDFYRHAMTHRRLHSHMRTNTYVYTHTHVYTHTDAHIDRQIYKEKHSGVTEDLALKSECLHLLSVTDSSILATDFFFCARTPNSGPSVC